MVFEYLSESMLLEWLLLYLNYKNIKDKINDILPIYKYRFMTAVIEIHRHLIKINRILFVVNNLN